jgi:putative transcriptional regulator
MATKRITSEVAKYLRGLTDWKRVMAMTDEDVLAAARLDPDARLLTPEEMTQFKRKRINDLDAK